MRETYVKPWYKVLGYFMLCELGTLVAMLLVCLFMGALLFDNGLITKIDNTVFGTVPLWFVFFSALTIVSPFFAFAFYCGMVPKKYDLEWRKLHLIPFSPEDTDQPLFSPRKINKKEPIWKENYEFDATIKPHGVQRVVAGQGCKEYMKVIDEKGIKYLMDIDDFAVIAFKITNGEYTGRFTFDTTWRWPSIKEVKNA